MPRRPGGNWGKQTLSLAPPGEDASGPTSSLLPRTCSFPPTHAHSPVFMGTKSCASSALGTIVHKFPGRVSPSSHVCLQKVFMGEPLRFSELPVISCSIFTLVPALVIATLSYTVAWIREQMAPNLLKVAKLLTKSWY